MMAFKICSEQRMVMESIWGEWPRHGVLTRKGNQRTGIDAMRTAFSLSVNNSEH